MLLIILILLDLTASEVDDQTYCALRYRRLCQGKRQHVACHFSSPGPGPSCQNYTKIEFKSDLKHFVIHYINRRRQRIAAGNERVRGGAHLPRPEIMMLVGWDRELAYLAQRLADQCEFVHDYCRATVRFPYAGQSVGEVRWRRSSDSDKLSTQRVIRRVLDAWWGERRRAQIQQLVAPFRLNPKGSVWGHFSQLAVWTLRAVGCGAVRHGFDYTRMLLVCDFSHTNMLGQRTLNPGPLAPCPIHTIRRPRTAYPLLCAPVKRQISSENDYYEIKEKYKDDYDDDFENERVVTTVQPEHTSRVEIVKTAATNKYLRTTVLEDNGSMNFNTGITYLGTLEEPSTRRVLEKLQHELESKNSEKQLVPMSKYQEWVTKRNYFGRVREDQESVTNTLNTFVADEDEETSHMYYTKFTTKVNFGTKQSRQRWRQTRLRPQRPGVNALIKRPPEKSLRRPSVCYLKLDQDDVDQLYRDTGFKVNWRNQSSSL
ncbi:uncharacterized protein LOC125072987 [Vanessa atalanta]|uniref:uncharacterized protein LOC125072987 n=1 Tax=Vanessa atalanta TaxID=42275 RepID=UPI001FCCD2EC|nr:uncharacterized protein LOC125072987 [Vanessa atalanta]